MPGIQLAIGADTRAKIDTGKTASSVETKMMNKTDKAPKTKTMPNKIDKAKAEEGSLAKPFVPGGSPLSAATTGTTSTTTATPNK